MGLDWDWGSGSALGTAGALWESHCLAVAVAITMTIRDES